MQSNESRMLSVFSAYPLYTGLLALAFVALTFGDLDYPFSTLLLLLLTGLAFFFGSRMGGGTAKKGQAEVNLEHAVSELRTAVAGAVSNVVAEASELAETVVSEASELVDAVEEAVTEEPKPRRPRRRSTRAKA